MHNRFIALIDAGRVTSLEGLKRCFRRAAKRSHPDSGGAGSAHAVDDAATSFIEVRREYEEALGLFESGALPAVRTPVRATITRIREIRPWIMRRRKPAARAEDRPWSFDRSRFYLEFQDLLARGFPKNPKDSGARAAYLRSREIVLRLSEKWEVLPKGLFERYEKEFETMGSLAGSGGGYRRLRLALYQLLDFHNLGYRHLLVLARRSAEIEQAELAASGWKAATILFEALLLDLDRGAALADSRGDPFPARGPLDN